MLRLINYNTNTTNNNNKVVVGTLHAYPTNFLTKHPAFGQTHTFSLLLGVGCFVFYQG